MIGDKAWVFRQQRKMDMTSIWFGGELLCIGAAHRLPNRHYLGIISKMR